MRAWIDLWRACFAEHNLLTYASAIAFQSLVALVPLTLLLLGVLGELGLERVWRDELAPPVRVHASLPTFLAVDDAVEKVLAHAGPGLLLFAAALSIWEVSGSVRASMGALNAIAAAEEDRPAWRRLALSFALAAAVALCTVGAVLVVVGGSRVAAGEGGALHLLAGVLRWPAAAILLGLAVALVVRYAPARRFSKRWASAGSLAIVAAWLLASVLFRVYVDSIANFRSAVGSLAVFLVLTGYLYTCAIIFLVGVQLDELLRRRSADAAADSPAVGA